MQWDDSAIILSARKHGETSAVVRVLAREHGVFAGVVRGINSKANRGVVQPGNVVNATWNARLAEHIGTFKLELQQAYAAHIMADATRLAALTSACSIVELAMPERHPYPRLYRLFSTFLEDLIGRENWLQNYVRLELDLLAEAGFGLDLSECAATGSKEGLLYVSPKSGRAVSAEAGEPYRDKLLALPAFLLTPTKENAADMQETLAGVRLSGYFLDHWLLAPHNRKLPAARQRLLEILKVHDVKEIAS